MRSFAFLVGFLAVSLTGIGQPTSPFLQIADSIVHADPDWVDLDNDGLLDVFLMMQSTSGKHYVAIIPGDTINPLSQVGKIFPVISSQAYLIMDYNHDNAMDIMVSGKKNNVPATVIYLNNGEFQFEEKATTLPSFTKGRCADLNNDATTELIISGEDGGPFLKFMKQTADFSWVVLDSMILKCASIEVFDADGDGDTDLFVSGSRSADSLMSGFLINDGSYFYKATHALALEGKTSAGDLNGDGFFDIVVMGVDDRGQWHTKKYESGSSGYTIQDLSPVLNDGTPFIADLDYDGIADINYYGTTTSGDAVNVIRYSNGDTDQLYALIRGQRFGDIEHDGNLDLLSVVGDDNITITLPENLRKRRNAGPKKPVRAVALPVYDRVFMYWEKSPDDHTVTNSLTFDLHLSGPIKYQTGEFDLLNEKRLTVTHGNNGTQNFRLLKNLSPKDLQFAIQAIDNSFHSGPACIGDGQACATVAAEEISVCSRERVPLKSPPTALWFSFEKGFLGTGGEFDFSADAGDTVFYYNPVQEGCAALQAWTIKVNDDTLKVEKNEKYACAGTSLNFEVEPGWKNVVWTSQLKGALGTSGTINYQVTQPDSVFVTLSNDEGCKIIRKTAIKISKPEVKLTADHYKIMKGGEVPLQAEGAERYQWSPIAGLNDPDIPNPVATPLSSTQYTVTGYDSLECSSQTTVTILVEQTGFIPNLFSPNDDGQNDQLRIYGVGSAQRFTLSIYDREGALVYKTSDLAEALQQGWDGTKNGTKQPPGVYFWKVKGEMASGELLLNGKNSGSVVLIR